MASTPSRSGIPRLAVPQTSQAPPSATRAAPSQTPASEAHTCPHPTSKSLDPRPPASLQHPASPRQTSASTITPERAGHEMCGTDTTHAPHRQLRSAACTAVARMPTCQHPSRWRRAPGAVSQSHAPRR
eukprot:1811435-Rhodomonas_salina.2